MHRRVLVAHVVALSLLFSSVNTVWGANSLDQAPSAGVQPAGADEALLARLDSSSRSRVQEAFSELLRRGRAGSAVLLRALAIPRPEVQVTAAQLLWEFNVREAAPKFAELIDTESRTLQHTVILGLGHLRDPAYLPLLLDKLSRAKDTGTRSAVVTALGLLQEPSAVPVLEALLADEGEKIVRIGAAGALGLLGSKKGLELALAEARDPSYQRAALQALGQIGDDKAVGLLEEISGDPSARNRQAARIALRRVQLKALDAPGKRKILAEELREKDLVGEWAAAELVEVGGPESAALLKTVVKGERGEPRLWVVMQLLKLGVPYEEAVR